MRTHPVAFRLPAVRSLALSGLLSAAAGLLPAPAAPAATFDWRGGGSDNSWSNALNWQQLAAPPNDGTADLRFANAGAVFPASSRPTASTPSLSPPGPAPTTSTPAR